MMPQLEDFVVKRFSSRVPKKDGKLIRIVRYTDCSWGATEGLHTTTFHGTTYEEIIVSIDGALDTLLKNVINYDGDTIGISIKRVKDDSFFGRKDSSVFGCYINVHLGRIMGGDEVVTGLLSVPFNNEQKV